MDAIFAGQQKDETTELHELLLRLETRQPENYSENKQVQPQYPTVAPGQFPSVDMSSDFTIQSMYRLAGLQPPASQPTSTEVSPREFYDSSNFTTPATSETATPMQSDDEDMGAQGKSDIYSGRNLQVPSGALKRRLSFSETSSEKKAEITPTRARALSSADSTSMSVQDDDEMARRKKERNRISARLSRQRKKQQIVLLETQVQLELVPYIMLQ